ncbi:DUF6435 family protein [Colwellia sp. M166]|uniref:DUF6435 family protein n=1 Tax=Colwellia sp. M166 TaxID=2583805 RepID=UPI00359C82A6
MHIFSLFKKDPITKLNKRYQAKLEQAMNAQRNGDIRSYAMIMAEAENIQIKILELESSKKI